MLDLCLCCRQGKQKAEIIRCFDERDATTGACSNDNSLMRLLKDCIQLSSRSRIVNMATAESVSPVSVVAVATRLNPVPAKNTSSSTSGDVGAQRLK